MEDPIVEEIRPIRNEHAAQFNYGIEAIVADYKRLAAESNQPRVSFDPRKIETLIASSKTRPATAVK
jgi:hypothetical protein